MLSPGHHLYPAPDGSWRYSAPGDRFVRVTGPDRVLAATRHAATGPAAEPDPGVDPESLRALVSSLTERGVLTVDQPVADRRTTRVWLAGTNPVAGQLAALLGPRVALRTGPVDERVIAGTDVLVTVADWLPDATWRQLDEWCRAHDTAWHRCHAEDTRFVLGPFFVPGRTASYADTRARRLAASPVADELLALWRHLDSEPWLPPVRWSLAGAATLAGLLAEDVLRYVEGRPVPSLGHQLVVDVDGARIDRHPVLPVPDLAGPG